MGRWRSVLLGADGSGLKMRRRTLLKIKGNMVVVGDNLEIMRGMESGVIDLIYADPPFNTGKDWGAIQRQVGGRHERAI